MIKPELELHKEKQQQKHYYDKHAKQLTTLQPGQNVRVQIGKQWQLSPPCTRNQDHITYKYQNLMDKHIEGTGIT